MPFMNVIANATLVDWLGSVAGVFTTLAFLPQVWRSWRTGSARDLSLSWLVIFTAGVFLWFVYGLILAAWPLVLANMMSLLMLGILIFLKWRGRG